MARWRLSHLNLSTLPSRTRRAAAITFAVAVPQELAQVIAFGRWPGAPEAFDLVVDSVAIGLGLIGAARRNRLRATESAG